MVSSLEGIVKLFIKNKNVTSLVEWIKNLERQIKSLDDAVEKQDRHINLLLRALDKLISDTTGQGFRRSGRAGNEEKSNR